MNEYLGRGVNVLIDGQWGSTGKGKLGAWLALREQVGFATADFQSNAGHTVVLGEKRFVVNHVPSAFPNLDVVLYLAPASTITVSTFLRELDILDEFDVRKRINLHPHVAVITDEDVEEERRTMVGIASTMKGVGAALARKVRRKATLAKDVPELQPFVNDLTKTIARAARAGEVVMAETSQGYDLSLNHGHEYPYVTSRDVTTASVLSNLGVPPQLLARVWGCLRTFPIRVGNVVDGDGNVLGFSGPCYPDQRELTWAEVSESAGREVKEITTVTKRVRRIFTFSHAQFEKFVLACAPTDLFLNFVNYLDPLADNARGADAWTPRVLRFTEELEAMCSEFGYGGYAPRLSLIGTGPDNDAMSEAP